MPANIYLRHPSSLEHDTGDHPERAARIEAIERRLAAAGWSGFEPVLAPAADRAALEEVHPASHIDAIANLCARGGGMIDADTIVSRGSFEAALHSAGGALRAVDLLLGGEAELTFCGLRPPGHHAGRETAMGFCLFNNVAIGAVHALRRHGSERVLIVDWDVHHGNGTNDIFHATSSVLYASLHQWPLYPGTGSLRDNGAGDGEGYTVNLPLPPGSAGAEWLGMIDHVVAPIAHEFRPELILVSAGYDGHRDDPLASCLLDSADYGLMAASVGRLADELAAPLGFVLEGGYELGALAASVEATLEGALAKAATAVDLSESAACAREHYSRWWPSLAGVVR